MMNAVSSVLVVEDNTQVRCALVTLLTHAMGVSDIRQTSSAEQALDWLQTSQFTVVIADYQLGAMNGVELVQAMRRRGDETPLLLLSGVMDKQGLLQAMRQSRVECLPKPFEIADFTRTMNRLIAA